MKFKAFTLILVLLAGLSGCTSYKNVPYLQDPEAVNQYGKEIPLYDAKIMPKDLLSITINTTDPQAAAPFNLTVQTPLNAALTNINTTTQPTLQQYLVNNDGEIDFPVLGRLKVGGLTKNQADIAAFLSLPFVQDGVVCRKAEHTCRGREYGWEFVEGLFRFLFFLIEGIAYLDVQFAFGAVAQLQPRACLQLFGLFGRHEYVDRRGLVQRNVVAQHTVLRNRSIKPQLGHYLADQGAAFQDFHLIVEVVTHG